MMISNISLSSVQAREKEYPAIDIAKFFCAIMVVTIHVNPLADLNATLGYGLTQCLARIAVPFFFVAGGYFCFRKTSYESFDLKPPSIYAFKMLRLYIIWTMLYVPSILYGAYTDEGFLQGILGLGAGRPKTTHRGIDFSRAESDCTAIDQNR